MGFVQFMSSLAPLVRNLASVAGSRLLQKAFRRRLLLSRGSIRKVLGKKSGELEVLAYERMKADNSKSGALYTAGEFWARMNRQHAISIWGGGLEHLRNEDVNRTFSGPEPESRQVYGALLHLYYKHVQRQDTEGFLDRFEDPPVGGNDDQETVLGRTVSLDFLQSVEEAYRIRNAWRQAGRLGDPTVIVELGAGYGRLAYVSRKLMPNCTYVILDLPEALICAQSWLTRVLGPEVVPYADSAATTAFSRAELGSAKTFLLLPHQIERIDTDAVDVFVNIYSFAEMPTPSIQNYFRQLDRITNGVFYSKQRKEEMNAMDSAHVLESSYPIPNTWSQLFRCTSTLYEGFFEAAWATRGGGGV